MNAHPRWSGTQAGGTTAGEPAQPGSDRSAYELERNAVQWERASSRRADATGDTPISADRGASRRTPMSIQPNAVTSLHVEPGTRILCLDGSIWVVEDGAPRDIVLAAGDAHRCRTRGRALVTAWEPSAMLLVQSSGGVRARVIETLRGLLPAWMYPGSTMRSA